MVRLRQRRPFTEDSFSLGVQRMSERRKNKGTEDKETRNAEEEELKKGRKLGKEPK